MCFGACRCHRWFFTAHATATFTLTKDVGSLHRSRKPVSWNSRETRVVGKVGDTLRITNNDLVAHQLHTSGRPFAHPATAIQPGSSDDFFLQTAFDPDTSPTPSDHLSGPSALFWIEILAA